MTHIYRFIWLLFVFSFPFVSAAQTIKITLLGTGNPQPTIERFGPSKLIEVEGQYFLFDCGRGVSQRLWQKKIPLGKVNRLFLTHLHSDHIVGIPDFWLTGWLPANFGRRSASLQVWGPAGTRQMMESLQKAYDWDIKTRLGESNKPDSGIVVLAQDIKAGIVYEKGGIKITAFKVDHADFIDSALGHRLDYAGRSVVISGDTRYSENLIKFAKGADVLIHEAAVARPELIHKLITAGRILSCHASPKVNPKMAIYNHITMTSTDVNIPAAIIEDIIPGTRVFYKGFVEVSKGLTAIEIITCLVPY